MTNFKILTNKYDVFYILIINILPLLFYKILNWSVSEYFLYFLTESIIRGIVLFIKSIFYQGKKEIFVGIFGLILYLFVCILFTSFFTEIGFTTNEFNQLLYVFYIQHWYISLLPIILLQILDSFHSYFKKYEVETVKNHRGILLGRFIVFALLLFPLIMLLNFTKSPFFILILPIIIRTLYELDGKIKLKEKLSPSAPAKFIINFFIFLLILMFTLALIDKNIRTIDVIAGFAMFGFMLIIRKQIYSFKADVKK
jgi:hypothetical protein